MEEGDVGKTRWLFANTANTTAEERVGARGLKCSLHVPSFLCKNISYISRQAPVFIHVHNLCIYIYIFYIYFFVLFIHIYIYIKNIYICIYILCIYHIYIYITDRLCGHVRTI